VKPLSEDIEREEKLAAHKQEEIGGNDVELSVLKPGFRHATLKLELELRLEQKTVLELEEEYRIEVRREQIPSPFPGGRRPADRAVAAEHESSRGQNGLLLLFLLLGFLRKGGFGPAPKRDRCDTRCEEEPQPRG
jgi:hypothetical protein